MQAKGQAPTSCSDYTIQHIEAVQVIQDISNSVPLVAGKPTWLRIYLGADGDPFGDRVFHPRVPVTVNVRTEDGVVTSFDFDIEGPRPGAVRHNQPRQDRRGRDGGMAGWRLSILVNTHVWTGPLL